ncbi:MAG: hypothetical protein Q6363_009150 [Candidatus Njordarchaeota archaeon]
MIEHFRDSDVGTIFRPRIEIDQLESLISFSEDMPLHPEDAILENIRSLDLVKDALFHFVNEKEYFVYWVEKNRPKRYSKKTLVVDDIFLYIPYHFKKEDYGIYFRIEKLWNDFALFSSYAYRILQIGRMIRILAEESEAYMDRLRKIRRNVPVLINSLFVEYLVFHYAHSIAHHVFEDMATIFEYAKKGKYSLISSIEEENFCYYIAFSTLERYIPGVLLRSKKAERLVNILYPIVPKFRWDFVESINFATTKLLYVYYKVYESEEKCPVVYDKVKSKYGTLFWILWRMHYTYEEDIVEREIVPIIQRLFLTFY